MNILIVDDHAIVRQGIIALLKSHILGLKFHECDDAADAINTLTNGSWDLVITDITLPGQNGLELTKDIRAISPKLPVLIVSAHEEKDFAVRAIKLGASGYICKQSASDTIVQAVNHILTGGKYITPAVAEQLADSLSVGAPEKPHDALSNRELEVLKLTATGFTQKSIASKLGLSEKTIGTYRSRISLKLGISTIVDLTRYAVRYGLVD